MATRGLPNWPLLHADTASLPPNDALLLDAVRAWAAPASPGPVAQAAMVLAAAGAEAAALPLDRLLRALPALSPGCALCPKLRPGEGALLLAAGATQAGRRSTALALLQGLAPPLAAWQAMPALIHLAAALRGCGVTLRHHLP